MGAARIPQHALPLQVAAVCYRRRGPSVEFLLVNTNGGGKWTFPKGDPESYLSHGQAAEREAWEEAGVRGRIELATFLPLHPFQRRFLETSRSAGVCDQGISARGGAQRKSRTRLAGIPPGSAPRKPRRSWPKAAK